MSMRDYKVIKELGSGAFGTVMLVQQGSTKYCVKKVDVRRMPKKERDAAVKEAHVLRKFKHPNIVQYKDQFIEDGTLCIVVRRCHPPCGIIARARSSDAPLPPSQCSDSSLSGADGARRGWRSARTAQEAAWPPSQGGHDPEL